MELGCKIVQLRKQNKLTQKKLADKLNVTKQTISKWELGKSRPKIQYLKNICKEYNIKLEELI